MPDKKPVEVRPLVKGRAALMNAARFGQDTIIKRLLAGKIDQETKNAALISAIINNQTAVVQQLIEAGANVNAREQLFGRTPLMYITNKISKEIETLLKIAGAVR